MFARRGNAFTLFQKAGADIQAEIIAVYGFTSSG